MLVLQNITKKRAEKNKKNNLHNFFYGYKLGKKIQQLVVVTCMFKSWSEFIALVRCNHSNRLNIFLETSLWEKKVAEVLREKRP